MSKPTAAQRLASNLTAAPAPVHSRTWRCAALSDSAGGRKEVDPTSLEAAASTMETIWDLACQRDEDSLLCFIPDDVLEQAAELRNTMEYSE